MKKSVVDISADDMFEKFLRAYCPIKRVSGSKPARPHFTVSQSKIPGFVDLFSRFEGYVFQNGLYRLHNLEKIPFWNEMISVGFPESGNQMLCFGCDWLGRQFAVDTRPNEGSTVFMFEPGTGEAFELPCNFIDFHNVELTEHPNDSLASDFFKQWLQGNPSGLTADECVGYIQPLILGGSDTEDNMEKSNLEVYVYICSQLLEKTRNLPTGTAINHFKFLDNDNS